VATRRIKGVKKGSQFRYNASVSKKYASRLKAITGRMTASVKKDLLALFDGIGCNDSVAIIRGISDKTRVLLNRLDADWEKEFNIIAKNMTPRMMKSVLQESKTASLRNLRQLYEHRQIPMKMNTLEMQNVFKASVNQAVDLIRTIPVQYFDGIKGEVMRSISSGGTFADLVKEFDKHEGKTKHRSENIAMDQTRKAYNSFNRTLCTQSGVTEGIWIHTGGTLDPRKSHREFNGKPFKLAEGAPVGTMKGRNKYVMPGEEPFCRCTFTPILDFNDD